MQLLFFGAREVGAPPPLTQGDICVNTCGLIGEPSWNPDPKGARSVFLSLKLHDEAHIISFLIWIFIMVAHSHGGLRNTPLLLSKHHFEISLFLTPDDSRYSSHCFCTRFYYSLLYLWWWPSRVCGLSGASLRQQYIYIYIYSLVLGGFFCTFIFTFIKLQTLPLAAGWTFRPENSFSESVFCGFWEWFWIRTEKHSFKINSLQHKSLHRDTSEVRLV